MPKINGLDVADYDVAASETDRSQKRRAVYGCSSPEPGYNSCIRRYASDFDNIRGHILRKDFAVQASTFNEEA